MCLPPSSPLSYSQTTFFFFFFPFFGPPPPNSSTNSWHLVLEPDVWVIRTSSVVCIQSSPAGINHCQDASNPLKPLFSWVLEITSCESSTEQDVPDKDPHCRLSFPPKKHHRLAPETWDHAGFLKAQTSTRRRLITITCIQSRLQASSSHAGALRQRQGWSRFLSR